MDLMQQAGVLVYNVWDEGQQKMFAEEVRINEKVTKLTERAVNARVRRVRREWKRKGKLEDFESMYGSPEELSLDGTRERAREIYGMFESPEAFDQLVRDIEMGVPTRNVIVHYPEFEIDPGEEVAPSIVPSS
jgi:hypothetical protein